MGENNFTKHPGIKGVAFSKKLEIKIQLYSIDAVWSMAVVYPELLLWKCKYCSKTEAAFHSGL